MAANREAVLAAHNGDVLDLEGFDGKPIKGQVLFHFIWKGAKRVYVLVLDNHITVFSDLSGEALLNATEPTLRDAMVEYERIEWAEHAKYMERRGLSSNTPYAYLVELEKEMHDLTEERRNVRVMLLYLSSQLYDRLMHPRVDPEDLRLAALWAMWSPMHMDNQGRPSWAALKPLTPG